MRPTDLQTLLPRSTELTRSKDVEARRPEVFQKHFAAETNRQYLRKQQTVGGPAQARNPRVEKDKEKEKESPGGEAADRPDAETAAQGKDPSGKDPSGKDPSDKDRSKQSGPGRPDGTGRLVNVVIGDGWGRA